jgi:hypothetical protein
MTWLAIVLLGIGGFLVGGVVSLWNTSRGAAVVCAVLAAAAIAGGVLWLID